MAFTPIADEQQAGFTPVSEGGFTPVKKGEPKIDVLGALPETLNVAGLDTGISINPELSAYLVNFGGKMAGSYRGAKQLLGLDNGQEAGNQEALNALEADPTVGGYAKAGGFVGAGFDPVTYALPIAKAKTAVDLAKYGAASGGVAGFLNPVAEGDSRVANTAVGATAGAVAVPVIGTVANRLSGAARMPFRAAPPEVRAPVEVAPTATAGPTAREIVEEFSDVVLKAKPGNVASRQVAQEVAQGTRVAGDFAEPLFKQEVAPETTKGIAALAKEFFEANPGMRDPSRLVSDDIHRYVAGGAIPEEMLAKHGLDGQKFADIWRASITDHARSLGYLSQVMREAQAKMTPEEIEVMRAAGGFAEDAAYVRPLWKKLTDTWRALLVTQPATAVRNAITQAGRVGLDVIQAPIDHWLQKMTGRPVTVHPLDGFEEAMSLFTKNKANVDKILSAFPKEKDRLFQNYLSDVTTGTDVESKAWRGIEAGVQAANILNRSQEFMIRRAIFQTSLSHIMRGKGMDLQQIIKNNEIGKIGTDDVRNAVQNSLNKTFAETPAYGTMSRKLVDAVNAVPGANIAIPFPRFMYNAIKFQYEYSPLGVLSYLSEAERSAFVAGDVSKMSKAVIGSAMFGAAMMFRNSDYAAEKWYEAQTDEGKVIDLRPFNPFASYLFVADVLKRQKEGTLYKLSGSDIAQGLLSTNMRAGTGLYLLDSAIGMMGKTADEQKLGSKAKELTGDFLAGFFTPLNVFRDAYDQITTGQSVARDTRQEPILGPIKNRLPVLSQTLPEAEFATREGPKSYENPLLRQATGVSIQGAKNSFEKELDRLGFEGRDVLTNSGDRELDSLYKRGMGAVAERVLVPLVESEKYNALSDSVKGVILQEAIGEVRREVKEAINEDLPEEKKLQIEIKKQPPRLRLLLKELGVRTEVAGQGNE